jgi:hypothetical protein
MDDCGGGWIDLSRDKNGIRMDSDFCNERKASWELEGWAKLGKLIGFYKESYQ